MKKIGTNLKKEEIALSKGFMKWYRVVEDELRLFVNERAVNENKEVLNKIYWKENRAELCLDNLEYSTKFYNQYKDYPVRFYVKADVGASYSEYAVDRWTLGERGIVVYLKE